MKSTNRSKPRIVSLPKMSDSRGNLTFVQEDDAIPFKIRRVYWVYDVPRGEYRGGHSHIQSEEVMVAMSGDFKVNIFDGEKWVVFSLDSPWEGLYVPAGYWHTLDGFSEGSVCMVLSSTIYGENDYVRDLEEYKKSLERGEYV